MKNDTLKKISKCALGFDGVLRRCFPVRDSKGGSDDGLDRTGRCVTDAVSMKNKLNDGEIIFVDYPASFAHSLWRAQEFSLFKRYRRIFKTPVMDLGCGDGSFSSVLFGAQELDYGVDIDRVALEVARGYGVYKTLLEVSDSKVPVEASSIATVFSNSVLEHTVDLVGVMDEVERVLQPGGGFVFTVPVKQLEADLSDLFGKEESMRINSDMVHRNLYDIGEWISILEDRKFSVEISQQYQPRWFTCLYRCLSIRFLRRCLRAVIIGMWPILKNLFAEMVKASISLTVDDGGNVFIVARKSSEQYKENKVEC